jgi:hypothetical protein
MSILYFFCCKGTTKPMQLGCKSNFLPKDVLYTDYFIYFCNQNIVKNLIRNEKDPIIINEDRYWHRAIGRIAAGNSHHLAEHPVGAG